METTRTERIRLGIFLLVCLGAIVAFGIFLAEQRLSNRKTEYHTIFSESVIGLAVDAKVKLNGINVGRVKRIYFDSTNLKNVIVEFEVDRGTPIKASTRAQMTSGISLTGQKDLVLSGGHINENDVPEGGLVPAGKSIFDKLSIQAESSMEKLQLLLDNVNNILSEENAVRIENTLSNLEQASRNTNKLIKSTQRPMQEIEASMISLHKTAVEFEEAKIAQKLEQDLVTLQAKLDDIDTKTINDNLISTLQSVNNLSQRTDLVLYNNQGRLAEALDQINVILNNLTDFSQKLRQNPSSLIRAPEQTGR